MSYHQCDKKSTRGPYVPLTDNTAANLKLVEEAISNKTDLWISYDMGSNGKGSRKITPWQVTQNNKGHLVDALCHIANTTHQFYVHRMVRVEDHNWNALSVPPHSQQEQAQLLPVSPTIQRKCNALFLFFTDLILMCIQRFLHL
jgi:predicted DNA-binding transcriptional regulator YafY